MYTEKNVTTLKKKIIRNEKFPLSFISSLANVMTYLVGVALALTGSYESYNPPREHQRDARFTGEILWKA